MRDEMARLRAEREQERLVSRECDQLEISALKGTLECEEQKHEAALISVREAARKTLAELEQMRVRRQEDEQKHRAASSVEQRLRQEIATHENNDKKRQNELQAIRNLKKENDETLAILQFTQAKEKSDLRAQLEREKSQMRAQFDREKTEVQQKNAEENAALYEALHEYGESRDATLAQGESERANAFCAFQNQLAGELHTVQTRNRKEISTAASQVAEQKGRMAWMTKDIENYALQATQAEATIKSFKEQVEALTQRLSEQSNAKLTADQQQSSHIANITREKDSAQQRASAAEEEARRIGEELKQQQTAARTATAEKDRTHRQCEDSMRQLEESKEQVQQQKEALTQTMKQLELTTNSAIEKSAEAATIQRQLDQATRQLREQLAAAAQKESSLQQKLQEEKKAWEATKKQADDGLKEQRRRYNEQERSIHNLKVTCATLQGQATGHCEKFEEAATMLNEQMCHNRQLQAELSKAQDAQLAATEDAARAQASLKFQGLLTHECQNNAQLAVSQLQQATAAAAQGALQRQQDHTESMDEMYERMQQMRLDAQNQKRQMQSMMKTAFTQIVEYSHDSRKAHKKIEEALCNRVAPQEIAYQLRIVRAQFLRECKHSFVDGCFLVAMKALRNALLCDDSLSHLLHRTNNNREEIDFTAGSVIAGASQRIDECGDEQAEQEVKRITQQRSKSQQGGAILALMPPPSSDDQQQNTRQRSQSQHSSVLVQAELEPQPRDPSIREGSRARSRSGEAANREQSMFDLCTTQQIRELSPMRFDNDCAFAGYKAPPALISMLCGTSAEPSQENESERQGFQSACVN